ncbi:sialate O-acetylesterase [Dyadobacter subterraneus]|uniref:T9SS type A sorting domain-containing protein n=1 Tax=Dyadobacter subterraneus TaxID=2773304 RepID=A0ABR9W8N2_9BACT|nr:sialate O-acetylesterase [Dyadobacter subterraneus]MBE9461810.1 T9SS type A sorting domain-containing protein [Dyadobacter subterraneus]
MNINFYLNLLSRTFPFFLTLLISIFLTISTVNPANAQRFYSVVFNQLPQDYQLYPRNENSESIVPISGMIETTGFNYMSVQVFRDDKLINYLKAPISYNSNKTGSFAMQAKIRAELAEYSFKVYACQAKDSVLIVARANVVSGDVYILTGQSNSTGFFTEADTNQYCRTFGKITGTLNTETYNPADTLWALSNQQAYYNGVGTMGFEIQKQLSQTSGIPNCLINGGFHWSSAAMHAQRTESNPADLTNGYGRMLYRIQKGGLTEAAKTFIFRQGETEAYHEGVDWPGNFKKLYNNLKLDLPNLAKLYVFQIDVIYYQSTTGAQIRDYQRKLPEIYPDVRVLSTVGTQEFDGLHYGREGNRQSGLELSRLIAKDFYGLKDTVNINSPALKKAFYASAEKKQLILTFDEGQQLVYPEKYSPKAGVLLDMKDFFYLNNSAGNVLSGKADNNRIILELNGSQTATTIDYLPPFVVDGGPFYPYTGPYIKNKLGMRALTFYNVNISNALQTPVLAASIDEMAKATLSWSAVADAKSYILQRKSSSETDFKTVADLQAAAKNYQDDLSAETGKITYRLKSVGQSSESVDYGYAEVLAPVVLGVSKEENDLISVYPNPASKNEKVTIRFKQAVSGSLNLINATGKIIGKQAMKHQNEASFDISILSTAVYFFQLDSEEKLPAKKLLVR